MSYPACHFGVSGIPTSQPSKCHYWEGGLSPSKTENHCGDSYHYIVPMCIWVFPKMVGFPPKSSNLIGFSIIFTIHFGGFPPIFGSTPISIPSRQLWNFMGFLSSSCHVANGLPPGLAAPNSKRIKPNKILAPWQRHLFFWSKNYIRKKLS